MKQFDQKLLAELARWAEHRFFEFKTQELANGAWGFAKMKQSDEKMFAALARAAE